MRKAAILAFILVMAVGGSVQAKANVGKVTGTATYYALGTPASWRTLSISAQTSDPVKGTWTWVRPSGTYSGRVTCLRVAGDDAWIAGSAPGTGVEAIQAVFFWVHDGGTPGTRGDRVFGWGADPDQTLADMETACQNKATDFFGYEPSPVVSGNLTIRTGS